MKILFKDEKFKLETIEILTRLVTDAELSGKPEILIGDQLTCKIIRGAKRWRESDISPTDRLKWALEVPESPPRSHHMDGKQGHGKPLDQVMEHYNLVLKQALRTSGGNATDKHIKEVSLCSLFLMEAAKKADQEFGITPRSTRHTTRDASADIHKITDHLLENKVTAPQAGRTTPTFRDVTEDGFKKMSQAWLKQVLVRAPDVESVRSTDTEQEPMQGTIDLDYELYHSH